MYIPLLASSFICWWCLESSLHFRATVNNVAMNTGIQFTQVLPSTWSTLGENFASFFTYFTWNTGRKKQSSSFHWLTHEILATARQGQGEARSQESHPDFLRGGRDSGLESLLCLPGCTSAGSWIGSGVLRSQTRHLDRGFVRSKQWLKYYIKCPQYVVKSHFHCRLN